MRVALSGTPGTGKTSASQLLRKHGCCVYSLNDIALEHKFILGVDKQRQSKILDIPALDRFVQKTMLANDIVFFEGLAAHLLTCMQKVVLLRCHPQTLRIRLQKRRWNAKKIQENCEAEALDIILCEAVEHHAQHDIFEIDTTDKTSKEVVQAINEICSNSFAPIAKYKIGNIDWAEELLHLSFPQRR